MFPVIICLYKVILGYLNNNLKFFRRFFFLIFCKNCVSYCHIPEHVCQFREKGDLMQPNDKGENKTYKMFMNLLTTWKLRQNL